MPYIKEEDRSKTLKNGAITPGSLNFFLTQDCLAYLKAVGTSYQTYNDIIGALECAKQEFYRRMVVPYEDKKKEMNGDVYPV